MTGKPAARREDRTLKGGPITQGSRNVWIGTTGGVACSTCPHGVALEGNPVNPLLGAKIQAGEVDLALPGPMPFVVSRGTIPVIKRIRPRLLACLAQVGGCPSSLRCCKPMTP